MARIIALYYWNWVEVPESGSGSSSEGSSPVIQALIFDMDGLLIDSEPLWHRAEIEIFGTVGLTLTPQQCMETTGVRIDAVVERRYREHRWTELTVQQVEARIIERVQQLAITEGKALPGVYDLLDFASGLGLPMAVASSSPPGMIDAIVRHLGLQDKFKVLCSAATEVHGKPHPAVYLRTAQLLGTVPRHCLAFEDSVPGVQSALAAGMQVVAVPVAEQFERHEFALATLKVRSLAGFLANHAATLLTRPG